MKDKIYSVKDNAVEAYGKPFHAPTKGFAIRSFSDEVNRPDSQLAKHPEDFSLYELGTWDNQKGNYTNLPEPQFIGKASDFINSEIPTGNT